MNVKKLISVATIMLTVGMIHAQGSNGLKIHYLGANHSLIQVKQPQKYLLLPVEETAPEALARQISIRIALSVDLFSCITNPILCFLTIHCLYFLPYTFPSDGKKFHR